LKENLFMNEKRHFARIQWLIPCLYSYSKEGNGQRIYAWGLIRNISVGGAEMATRFPIERNIKLSLTFRIGQKSQFENLSAQILQTKSQGIYNVCRLDFGEKVDYLVLEKAMNSLLAEQLEEI